MPTIVHVVFVAPDLHKVATIRSFLEPLHRVSVEAANEEMLADITFADIILVPLRGLTPSLTQMLVHRLECMQTSGVVLLSDGKGMTGMPDGLLAREDVVVCPSSDGTLVASMVGLFRRIILAERPERFAAFYGPGKAPQKPGSDLPELGTGRLRAALDYMEEALFVLDGIRMDGRIIDFLISDANRAGLEMVNLEYSAFIGRRLSELANGPGGGNYFERYKKILESGIAQTEVYAIDEPNFKPKWVQSTVAPTTDGVVITVRDITQQKMAAQQLTSDRDLLLATINAIDDEIYIKDTERRFILVNRSVVEQLGCSSSEEVLGKTDEELMPSHNLDLALAQDMQVLKKGVPVINWEGYAYLDANKTQIRRCILVSKYPYLDSKGNIVGLIGINRDITQKKQAELRIKRSLREKEVLLKEIHHRVKNNLAVISGLLLIRAENMDEQTRHILQESEIRIRSMAMIHEKLYHHDMYSGIEFGSYARDLSATIAETYGGSPVHIHVVLDASPTYIDLNRAMPCALMVNEILTNAYKHAFRGRAEGVIRLAFGMEDGRYRLTIADDGVGLPEGLDPSASQSMGMVLIHGLARQLEADLQIKRDGGTEFSIEFSA